MCGRRNRSGCNPGNVKNPRGRIELIFFVIDRCIFSINNCFVYIQKMGFIESQICYTDKPLLVAVCLTFITNVQVNSLAVKQACQIAFSLRIASLAIIRSVNISQSNSFSGGNFKCVTINHIFHYSFIVNFSVNIENENVGYKKR